MINTGTAGAAQIGRKDDERKNAGSETKVVKPSADKKCCVNQF